MTLIFFAATLFDVNDWSRDEFQFKAALGGGSTVYLYIPPKAPRVRALLLLQQNVAEQMIAVHPAIRRACDANDVAVAWCAPGFDATFEDDPGRTHRMLEEEFGRIGRSIGYPELGAAPLVTFGHSSTNAYCQNAAESRPDRVLAVLATHGGSRVDAFRAYRGPVLLFIGHYWEQRQQIRSVGSNKNMQSLNKVMKRLQEGWMPISVVEEYGSGHFDYSDRVVEVFARFIDKAVQARLDKDGKLKDIDPASGWVASIPSSPGGPIPVRPYAPDEARSVWFFDRELAEAAVTVIGGNGPWDRACQLIGYAHPDGTPAPFGKSGLVNPVPYEIVPGTNEIRLFPVHLDAFPAGFKEEGQPIGVPADRAITLEYVCGPYLYRDGDGKHRVKLNRGGTSGYLVARHPGDKTLRPAVQPTRLVLGAGGGTAPAFNPGDQKPGARIPLKTAGSAKEFVGFYVDHGPARIVGSEIEILPLPANSRGPLEVELVSYALGRGVTGTSSAKFRVGR